MVDRSLYLEVDAYEFQKTMTVMVTMNQPVGLFIARHLNQKDCEAIQRELHHSLTGLFYVWFYL